MNLHLAEIAATVAAGAHAVLVLDGAGWHRGGRLAVPPNISLLQLPPYAPELNPGRERLGILAPEPARQSRLRRLQRDRRRLLQSWNDFVADPALVASVAARTWADGS